MERKTYHQVKKNFLEIINKKANQKEKLKLIDLYIFFNVIFLKLNSKLFMWSFSHIPGIFFLYFELLNPLFYLFVHFLYFVFYFDKKYHKDCDIEVDNIEMELIVLKDLKSEIQSLSI